MKKRFSSWLTFAAALALAGCYQLQYEVAVGGAVERFEQDWRMCGGALADICERGFSIADRTSNAQAVIDELEKGLGVNEPSLAARGDLYHNLTAVYQSVGAWDKAVHAAKMAQALYREAGRAYAIEPVLARARAAGVNPDTIQPEPIGPNPTEPTASPARTASGHDDAPRGRRIDNLQGPLVCKEPLVIQGADITVTNAFHVVRVEAGCHLSIIDSKLTLKIEPGKGLVGDEAHPERTSAEVLTLVGGKVVVRGSTLGVEAPHAKAGQHAAIRVGEMANDASQSDIELAIDDSQVTGDIYVGTERAVLRSHRLTLAGTFSCAGAKALELTDLVASSGGEHVTFDARCPLALINPTLTAEGDAPALSVAAKQPITVTGGKITSKGYIAITVRDGDSKVSLTRVTALGASGALGVNDGDVTVLEGAFSASEESGTAIAANREKARVTVTKSTLSGEARASRGAVLSLHSVTQTSPRWGLVAERQATLTANACTVQAGTIGAWAQKDGTIELVGGSVSGAKHRLRLDDRSRITAQGTQLAGGPVLNKGGTLK